MSWNQLTLWSEAMTTVQDKTIFTWLTEYAHAGSSTDVTQVSLLKLKADTSDFSSWEWPTSGIIYAGECWMLNCLEGPRHDMCTSSDTSDKTKTAPVKPCSIPSTETTLLDTDDVDLSLIGLDTTSCNTTKDTTSLGKSQKLTAVPITQRDAKEWVNTHHKHNKAPHGDVFRVAARADEMIVGVAMVGRPVSRVLQSQGAAEVIRMCLVEGAPKNTASFLYGRCIRAARALGYTALYTYSLDFEEGASIRASSFVVDGHVRGRSWSCKGRPRVDQPFQKTNKIRWKKEL